MKTATIILATLNSAPLVPYPFVALPLISILRLGGSAAGEGITKQLIALGFIWGTLLFPVVLIFNHWNSFRKYRVGLFRDAMTHQLVSSFYILLLAIYFLAWDASQKM